MHWPTNPQSISLADLGWVNTAYLASTSSKGDPTIVWGTSIRTEALNQFVADQRRQAGAMISITHVLIQAVAQAIAQNPRVNRRVVGGRVVEYKNVNVTMPILETRTGEVNVIFINDAEKRPLADISRIVWENARNAAVRGAKAQVVGADSSTKPSRWKKWLGLQWVHWMAPIGFFLANRFRLPLVFYPDAIGSNAFVNNLGFQGAPPMISYKPSTLPTNSFGVSVTMGLVETKPVVEGDSVVLGQVAPLFIRIDHRLVNGYQAAAFISTLRNLLQAPEKLEQLSSVAKPDAPETPTS